MRLTGCGGHNQPCEWQHWLKQTPNQPFFGDLTEDALISYALHNFRKKDKELYLAPLRFFPMVKSAVKAMDAVQRVLLKTIKTYGQPVCRLRARQKARGKIMWLTECERQTLWKRSRRW